jgi:mono/diheme cytochrome c family protein
MNEEKSATKPHKMRGKFILPIFLVAVAAPPAYAQPQMPGAVFSRYCVTCHNATAKVGGLVINPADVGNVGANPELWEKVVRKLRSSAMPPANAPRPDQATYESVATFLETELDRAAAAKPNPGNVPLLHRLSRTEYQNAVRDLLALDALPQEMDFSTLLPQDNISSGFDNIADLLFVSPATMERYLDAARKISRIAVGDPGMPPMVNIHRLSPEHWQDARVDELPFGTRGGIAVRSTFPVDGDYTIKLEVAGAGREAHELEITVDGERLHVITIGGAAPAGGGGGAPGRGDAAPALEFRIPVKAGVRLVGITFVEQNQARNEETLKPRMRARGTKPALVSAIISGPHKVVGPGDSPSRRRIFVCRPEQGGGAPATGNEPGCARQILSTLVRRAYRRPGTDAEIERLLPFYTAGRAEGGFDRGIQKALERLLVSPQFLFRIERDPANVASGTAHRVSDLELASRMSFFLWSSIPDDELLDAAIGGKLSQPAVFERQIRRMLADPRSESMVTNFAAQWLFLRDIESKRPDEILFPEWDETLRAAFHRETELFLNSILRENRSVHELLTANYTFLNERLAKHYRIPNVQGSYFRRITLPEGSLRGGLLGQGSILTVTSYAARTSPVVRGKWVLENLLAAPPPPPPPNVPALKTESDEPGKTLTMREATVRHRASPVCASCHALMDPIGFAMENFDAVGKWRDSDAGAPIDTAGVLPNGTKIDGLAGLKQALLAKPEQFASAVTEKLLMYALGRNLQYYDVPAVRAIVRAAARDSHRFSSIVMGIVKSAPFQMRTAQ